MRSPYHDDFALPHRAGVARQKTNREPQCRLPRQERGENMLYAAQVNSKSLQRITPYIPANIPKERLSQQVEIALALFKAGVCVSANLTIGQFDSHANNDVDQMKLIPEFLAGIAYLIRRAEDLKIREKLVVVVQSEMGRTPTYNNGNGKDHWSIGSIMFLGPGIRGNRVIGATDEKQFAVPLIRKRWLAKRKRTKASASGPSIFTTLCGNTPASLIMPSARNSRWALPTRKGSRGFVDNFPIAATVTMIVGLAAEVRSRRVGLGGRVFRVRPPTKPRPPRQTLRNGIYVVAMHI